MPEAIMTDSEHERSVTSCPVSVCMATYNGEQYITNQIASILPQLAPDDELVVVDDHSTDSTPDVVESIGDPRIRLIRSHRNVGYVRAFETALAEAHGDIIFLSDQDDVWMPNRVSLMIEAMGSNLMVVGNCQHVGGSPGFIEGLRLREKDSGKHIRNVLGIVIGYRPNWGCAMAIRRELLDIVLPFPPWMHESHDAYLAIAANLLGKVHYLDEDTIWHRVHAQNLTPKRLRSARRILKARVNFVSEIGLLSMRVLKRNKHPRDLTSTSAKVAASSKNEPEEKDSVALVVSCYDPPANLVPRVKTWINEIGPIIAVDDASPSTDPTFWKKLTEVGAEVIHVEENSGIAHCLNLGIRRARTQYAPDWILTMDQDSEFGSEYVPNALAALSAVPDPNSVGMLCSSSQNGYRVRTWNRRREIPESFDPMQSGSLLRTSMLDDIGLLREDFFIDAVDSELNARARTHGWVLLAAPGCDLTHSLGQARPMIIMGCHAHWGRKPLFIYHHDPFRVYYMTRNTLVVAREYLHDQPAWVLCRLLAELEGHIIRLTFDPKRRENLVAVAHGLRDGALNRLGRIDPTLMANLQQDRV